MTNAECNIQRIIKVDRDEFNCSYDEWVEHEKKYGHYDPIIIKYHTKIRTFLNKKNLEEEWDYFLRSDRGDGISIYFLTGKCNLKLILNLLNYLHINPARYEACSIYSIYWNTLFKDYVVFGIKRECLVGESFQDTLMWGYIMDYINRIRLKVQKIKYIDSELERPDLLLIEEIGYKETRKDLRNEIHELVKKAIKENN